MNAAIDLATRFPLVVFTVLLALLAVYWLLVALRLAPVELFEHDSLKDDHLASALVSLGFAGVPASLALTLLVVLAGALTLALELAVLRWLPLGFFRIPLGVGVIWGAFALASPPASWLCLRLLHRLHQRSPHAPERLPRCLLGERVRVTATAEGDEPVVTAVLEDDPTHEVRLATKSGDVPHPGEHRVLVKYLTVDGRYRAVPERDYLDARTRLRRLHLLRRLQRRDGTSA
ncbi:hypothetical protein BOX17_12475 [Halomonas aestuarii]|uniref:DUF1449 domain-containing protein n=1 Tax=Halomonas aestuarii TaxID=1897729 RepID=A0A1J0VI56_9GAMM|nr:hypothetical protein [Halomonas aestuarii]APE31698.1 hypothetical protein BOX17_12475 [Halomonas aestuarii]